MRILPRKLTFQLTPLLDLLLIVIFAQYMEVREETKIERAASLTRTEAAERRLEALQREAARSTEDLAALRALRADEVAALERREERIAELEARNQLLQESFQEQELELLEALAEAREQRDVVGQLALELFRVPPDLLDQALAPPGGAAALSLEEQERLREQFQDLAQQRADEMVMHLLTYAELRKRADVWDLHVAENGMITFDTGTHTHQFRANTAEAFSAELFQRYKSLPQPKGLVIILLSYDNIRIDWRQAVVRGLPLAADRMRADASGRSRFEFAILGYRPRGSGS